VAENRVVLNLHDPGAVLAQNLQVTICPDGQTSLDVPGCLPIRERVANHNPSFTGLQVYRDPTATLPHDNYQAYTLAPAQAVRISPTLDPYAYESYQTLRGSLQSGAIELVDEIEAPSIAWYCSAGTFTHDKTSASMTGSLDNFYTAPDQVPGGNGMVTLWLVARDQRGGEDMKTIDVHIAPRN
jgi:hypothetical protein